MLAYHGDKAIKAKFVARIKAHAKADEIEKGHYWDRGKGCAIGCTIHSADHMEYERQLGVPVALARLQDAIFEGLPNGSAKKFPLQFLTAIKPGADLSLVAPKFMLAQQKRNLRRMQTDKGEYAPLVIASLKDVINVLEGWIKNGKADESAAWSAERSAESAALSAERAAWSAARSAASAARSAASAAWSAESAESAESAASAARSAASAAWSAERSAERSAESAALSADYTWQAKTLLALLKAAK